MTIIESPRTSVVATDAYDIAVGWLADFADTMAEGLADDCAREPSSEEACRDAIEKLFLVDSWWRDLLSLTWNFRTFRGPEHIASAVIDHGRGAGYRHLSPPSPGSVQLVDRPLDGELIEVFFSFETSVGRGRGLLRLRRDDDQIWRAWTLLTTLQELHGHEPAVGQHRRVRLDEAARPGENWLDMRTRVQQFADSDPEVVIVGGGHGGLAVAAHLSAFGVETLVVERNPRVGDNWRNRYRSLTLHDPIWADHLPYLRFPASWPVHTPKDKLADWLESYVAAMDLNVWTSAEVTTASYDDATGTWTVQVGRADGSTRTLHPAHVVLATGIHGEAKRLDGVGLDSFHGHVMHSSEYVGIEPGTVGRAVVVGAGNSGHDIAEDLYRSGVAVTMVQRSSTYVMSQKNGLATLYGSLFFEGGPPVEDADLVMASIPYLLGLQRAVTQTKIIADLDEPILTALKDVGFRIDFGTNGAGSLSKIVTTSPGGYYIDVGCSQLIADGAIALAHGSVERLDEKGVVLDDGTRLDADLVVFATGYQNMRETARRLCGDEVADRCDPVWGLNEEGEISGMWRTCGHPGLWFMGGPLWIARFYSRYLALQIQGIQRGVAVHPAFSQQSN